MPLAINAEGNGLLVENWS